MAGSGIGTLHDAAAAADDDDVDFAKGLEDDVDEDGFDDDDPNAVSLIDELTWMTVLLL